MRKPPIPVNRRLYLQSLSAAAISSWLAGCGGGGAAPAAQVEGVTGSLNVSQIGGSQLKVFSVFDGLAEVVNGSFTTRVSEDMLQTLLVSDGNEKLRAMTIHISGKPLAVDASSTAVAIVFLTPGISTLDKTAGSARVLAIQAAAGFAAFLQLLQAAMLTQDLPTALADPAIRAARDVVVQQVTALIEAQALESPLEVVNQSQSDGYLVVKKDDSSTNTELKIQLSNEGFRFVKVVRKEEFNGQNQLAVPVLQGSPTKNSIIGGRGGASIAGFVSLAFGGALGAPGGATDTIDQSLHKADRLTYYVRGLGNPVHANDEAFPNDVQSVMEAEGGLHLGMTVFFYFLLPVVEPILSAFTGITAEEALSKVGKALGPAFTGGAAEAGFISTATALQAGDQTGFLVALGDLIISLTPIVLRALAGMFAQLLPGVVLIELALTLIGAFIATVNFSIAGVAFFRTPQRANAELVLGAPIHFLDQVIAADSRVRFVNLTSDGSLVYSWQPSSSSLYRRINRLGIPSLGLSYSPETTYELSEVVELIDGNRTGEILAQSVESLSSGSYVNRFYSYTNSNSGFSSQTLIGQVSYTPTFSYYGNPAIPGDDQSFQAWAINSQGDIAGTYSQFKEWFRWDINEYRPVLVKQLWWIPKGGSLIKKDFSQLLEQTLATAYPLGTWVRGGVGDQYVRVFGLNSSGVVLIGLYINSRDNEGSQNYSEHIAASFNMVTGRLIIIARSIEVGLASGLSNIRAGKINDKGQVALTRSEPGMVFAEFYNGTGATGEPIPTRVGFKNRFYVNDMTSNGDVAGFEQIWAPGGGVIGNKAGIWKASSVLGDVVDVHARLAGPTIAEPYSSSVARLGDDGTIVGAVITKRPTNPDLPAGPDNPEVDWVRDFVIQGTPAN